MLRKIKVYGSLAKFLKRRVFRADVANPAEAVRFLLANFPALRSHMADQHYKVLVSDNALDIGDQPEQLHYPIGADEEIKIVPVMVGAGGIGDAITQILVGVALVAAAIFIPGLGLGLAGATVTQIGLLGGALVLGGVSQLLTPTPNISAAQGAVGTQATTRETELDPQKSYSFSGIQNTSRQGVPVPLIYGETLVGSIVISAGIDTVQVSA